MREGSEMALRRSWVAAILMAALGSAGPSSPGARPSRKVVVDGNVRISTQALMSQFEVKEGDPYDEEVLRGEFQRLWT